MSFHAVDVRVEKNEEKFASAGADLRPVIRRSDRKEQNQSALLFSAIKVLHQQGSKYLGSFISNH